MHLNFISGNIQYPSPPFVNPLNRLTCTGSTAFNRLYSLGALIPHRINSQEACSTFFTFFLSDKIYRNFLHKKVVLLFVFFFGLLPVSTYKTHHIHSYIPSLYLIHTVMYRYIDFITSTIILLELMCRCDLYLFGLFFWPYVRLFQEMQIAAPRHEEEISLLTLADFRKLA